MNFKKWLKKNKKWFVLGLILAIILLILEIINSFLTPERGVISIKSVFTYLFLKSSYIIVLGLIPLFIFLGVMYLLIKQSLSKSNKRTKGVLQIVIISVIFGLFIIPNLYSPLELIGVEDRFYPQYIQDSFDKSHPDDPVTSTLALFSYSILVGLVIGIIMSVIYLGLKYEK